MEDDDFVYDDFSPSSSPPQKQLRSSDRVSSSVSRSLTRSDIDALMSARLSELSEVTDLSLDDCFVVLNKLGWDSSGTVEQAWFEDNGISVRRTVGLSSTSSSPCAFSKSSEPTFTCPICLSECNDVLRLEACGHKFCIKCYTQYLLTKVMDGQDSVHARCPAVKCHCVVPRSLIQTLLDSRTFSKYQDWCRYFYVSSCPDTLRWCRNPTGSCDLVVIVPSGVASSVSCRCGYVFCWKCGLESHVPVPCEFAEMWARKNSSESENIRWIIANTKPCPKCHKPIEKNQGCNHMTCSRKSGGCGSEFCWMCLQLWNTHGSATGGYYSCNLYSQKRDEGAEKLRTESKHALDRYMFYFGRYMNHQKSRELALKQLRDDTPDMIEILRKKYDLVDLGELEFIAETLTRVAECRLVLKWTYVYGYYLEEILLKNQQQAVKTKELFDYLQRNLEELTDRLHEYIEKDLVAFVKLGDSKDDEDHSVTSPKRASSSSKMTSPVSSSVMLPDDPGEVKRRLVQLRSQVCNQINVTRKFFDKIASELST